MRRAVAALLLLLAGCAPRAADEAGAAVASWFDAVQAGDLDRMAERLAACRGGEPRRRDCERRLAEHDASVAAQRELSFYRFDDPWGQGLIGALSLGRGAYWELNDFRLDASAGAEQEATARLRVLTHYRPEETRGLPSRARVEYLVAPLGTVRRLARGERGPGAQRQELVELVLEARLVRVGPRAPWLLVALRPLPETAVFRQVAWRPE